MAGIDRRTLLTSGAGVLVGANIPFAARAAAAAPPAPVAKVAVVKDVYFGETLDDPYRWMENDKDPDWLPFLKGQNDHTRATLDAIPARAALQRRVQQLSGAMTNTSAVKRAGGKLFHFTRPATANAGMLFIREDGRDRVLVDPTRLSDATTHISIDWWGVSPNGAYVVYGLSKNGSEDSVLHVMTVADGRDLADRIANTGPGSDLSTATPQWLDDSSGFFYNQLTGAVGTPERFLDSQARFHRLGADPATDPILMKRGLVAGVDYDKIQIPYILTFPGARHAILILRDVRPETRVLIAPLEDVVSGRARWTPIAGFDDVITGVKLDGDKLYLLANKGAPRGRIIRTSADRPSLSAAVEVVPQGPAVIEEFGRARDGLYLKMMDGGVNRLRRLGRDGRVMEIPLPFDGSIYGLFTDPNEDGALMLLTGWLTPTGVWSVSPAGRVTDTRFYPPPAIDLGVYEAIRGFAAAKDGTKIPYSLIYRKGLVRDGRSPAWVSAYGSYGLSPYTPVFDRRIFALIDAGFIVGYANVRGGGEFGREWHKAGQLENKPNTWRDLIAVCEHLCDQRYTSPSRLAIGGRSAGGITVGRAMTERPDLFAAVIDGVGWSNPLRYVAEQNSSGEEPEWGAITDPAGYRALKSIDSYQAVKDATPYPAVLLTTGVSDPSVAPFHVAKMTARLQAATSSKKPILLRVDFDAGHGINSTRDQYDREAADTYAFLLWQTGEPGYQPA